MTLQHTIYDLNTGETTVRDYTKDEIKAYENERKKNKEVNDALQAEAEAKATAKAAILDRIGLTADELQTILG